MTKVLSGILEVWKHRFPSGPANMASFGSDEPTEQKDEDGDSCKPRAQRKGQNCCTEVRSERLGGLETIRRDDCRRLWTLTEHIESKATTKGKGDWVLESPEFKQWYNSTASTIFWLSGIPGSGKTTLVNTVQAAIESRIGTTKPKVYFHIKIEDLPENPVKIIVKSLVNQIRALDTRLKSGLPEQRLATMVEKCLPANSSALCRIFQSMLDFLSLDAESFFFIDSLDDHPWIIDALLAATLSRAQDTAQIRTSKIMLSYRPSCKALNRHVEETITFGTGIKIDLDDSQAAKHNLTRYIEIEGDRLIDKYPQGELKIRKMVGFVQKRSGSCFLWAKLTLESIAQHMSLGHELDPLNSNVFPLALYEIYQQRLDHALSYNETQTKETLKWVLYATRPLDVLELNGAILRSSPSKFNTYSDPFPPVPSSQSVGAVLESIYGGLLQISESRYVVLSHRTVRDYLWDFKTRGFRKWPNLHYFHCHESIALACLRCLIGSIRVQNNKDHDHSAINCHKSFEKYAYDHWMKHYRIAEARSLQLTGLLYEYLQCFHGGGQKLFSWQEQKEFRHSTLRISAMSGFTELCKVMLQMGTSVDVHYDSSPMTPLHLAVSSGHLGTVRLLLEYGADKEARTPSGETSLFLAVRNADRDIVKLLIENGADIGSKTPKTKECPLHVAAANGAESVISLVCFERTTIDIDKACSDTQRPLGEDGVFCHCGRCEFRSLEQNSPCKCHVYHLGAANLENFNNPHERSWTSYLEARSDIGWTPLHYAAANGHDNVIRLLLQLGAHNNVPTIEGEFTDARLDKWPY